MLISVITLLLNLNKLLKIFNKTYKDIYYSNRLLPKSGVMNIKAFDHMTVCNGLLYYDIILHAPFIERRAEARMRFEKLLFGLLDLTTAPL